MERSTFIQVPPDVTDVRTLKRFLDKLVLQLDIAFGNRGTESFTKHSVFSNSISSMQELIDILNAKEHTYSLLDGSRDYTGVVAYDTEKTLDDLSLVYKKHIDDNFEPVFEKSTAFNKDFGVTAGTVTEGGTTTTNPIQPALANLGLTISNPPTQSEVQAISDKVDALLVILRSANIIEI